MHHRAMEVTSGPTLRVTRRASRPDRDWLLRAHDIKGVVSCLTLIASELKEARSIRQTVLGDRVLRACGRLMQLSGAPLCAEHGGPPSLAMLLEEVVIFAQILAGPRTRIETDAPELPLAAAVEAAVFRILLNLVANAVRSTNENGGGVVRIAVDLAGDGVTILVANDGAGLAAVTAPAGRRRPGSGLGLVIAESLARELGGGLELRKGRPGTTTLKLVLPIAIFTETV